jgi:hypothetical protein
MAAQHTDTRHDGPTPVSIVAHTHWDREWYRPFQAYRHDLVRLLDDLLPRLEADPGFRHFLLDGQTILVDDYLEVRPEAEGRLRRLVTAGRLAVGPWAVLMDEFCVGGETIVRNLQRGLARAAELGGALAVGYLPDMFGHVAQMPQLLRQAGLEHAVVWRGVPAAVDRTAFWWEAPDGSRVRAEHLYGSYANGAHVTAEPDRLVALTEAFERELGPRPLPGGGLLLMHGGDHRSPEPTLAAVAEAANARQDRYRFRIATLAEHLAAQPGADLPVWRGELRSGAFTNLLMGVASNRVDVHQATTAAERALVAVAEPLAALFVPWDPAVESPVPFLDLAWDRLIANSAHDSACACSVDEVVDQVLVRAREARTLAEGVTAEAMRWLAATVDAPAGAWVVANPSAHGRGGVVEVEVAGPGPPGDGLVQRVAHRAAAEALSALVAGPKIGWFLALLEGETYGGRPVAAVDVRAAELEVVVRLAAEDEPSIDVGPWRPAIRDLAGDDRVVRVRVVEPARTRWAVLVPPVAGLGWSTFGPAAGPAPVGVAPVTPAADGVGLANGLVAFTVEPHGTLHVVTADGLEARGLGRLVDGGDGGDTYTYSPPPDDRLVDRPVDVAVTVAEAGPVRGRVVVAARYRWPTHAVGDEWCVTARADADAEVTVTTTYELRAGEAFVRVRHELVNTCRDHRLRTHLPLPAPVAGSDAECAFAVVHRGLAAEGGPHEHPTPTFPSRRFVDASDGQVGLALLHDGLLEYEVVAGGRELALTLLRATGWLSRRQPHRRPNPAGPALPVTGAQVQGPRIAEYAVLLHRGDWRAADLHAAAGAALVPLPVARVGRSLRTRPASGTALAVTPGRAEVSAVRRIDDGVEVRLANPQPEPATVIVPTGSRRVDLRGRPVTGPGDDDGRLVVEPAGIATVVVPAAAVVAPRRPGP